MFNSHSIGLFRSRLRGVMFNYVIEVVNVSFYHKFVKLEEAKKLSISKVAKKRTSFNQHSFVLSFNFKFQSRTTVGGAVMHWKLT